MLIIHDYAVNFGPFHPTDPFQLAHYIFFDILHIKLEDIKGYKLPEIPVFRKNPVFFLLILAILHTEYSLPKFI